MSQTNARYVILQLMKIIVAFIAMLGWQNSSGSHVGAPACSHLPVVVGHL
uniref:Uncharacterized protein n=1 Tax=Arundo donax TaxID=35708 RepID=A0A0A9FP53_ARUDO